MSNTYQNEDFEDGVRAVISRYFIREDFCPVCKEEANFVKVVDCQPYWRCMSCLNILKRDFIQALDNTLPKIHEAERKVARKKDNDEPDEWEIQRARAHLRATKIAEAEENGDKSRL